MPVTGEWGQCEPVPEIARRRRGPLRIVLADDSFLMREALAAMVRPVPSFEIVAVCEDLPSLMDAVRAENPDVVVTDIRMPPTNTDEGIRAAGDLRVTHPQIGVVILSAYVETSYVVELLRLGADARAYLLKERLHDRAELIAAIHAVGRGESVIDPKLVELLVATRSQPTAPISQLTPREYEILGEIATGKGNTAIALTLHLSKRSIEKHIRSIFTKLELGDTEDVSRRVKAALIFLSAEPAPEAHAASSTGRRAPLPLPQAAPPVARAGRSDTG
jgi:DNA-binding NarL/FixJ family response regulator